MNRAIRRATTSSVIDIICHPNRKVTVRFTRVGVHGYQGMVSVVDANGSNVIVQYAYDAAGGLEHVDPKMP